MHFGILGFFTSLICISADILSSGVEAAPSPLRSNRMKREDMGSFNTSYSTPSSQTIAHGQQQLTSVMPLTNQQRLQCYETCSIHLVESLPENTTFADSVNPPLQLTHDAWVRLIRLAEKTIHIGAYKSSLRSSALPVELRDSARESDDIFDQLKTAAERGVRLEAVERLVSKENEAFTALSDSHLMERHLFNTTRIFDSGIMHAKFFIIDLLHFYLGSANFDWRSLSQKMELGLRVENCSCLALDLKILFDAYWAAAAMEKYDEAVFADLPALTSKSNPLRIRADGIDTDVYIAASPRRLVGKQRQWDLDAIVSVIDGAKNRLNIHVMDYLPVFVYEPKLLFWPVIDDAIRRAVIERGVKVRILTPARDFPGEALAALKSLQDIAEEAEQNNGRVDVRILTIPDVTADVIAHDRTSHRKFLSTEDTLLIETSNLSGDYFANTTGIAIVIKQGVPENQTGTVDTLKRPLINQAMQLFERDWKSIYATDLDKYMRNCYDKVHKQDLCKAAKLDLASGLLLENRSGARRIDLMWQLLLILSTVVIFMRTMTNTVL